MKPIVQVVVLGLMLGGGTAEATAPLQIRNRGQLEVENVPAADRAAELLDRAGELYLKYESIEIRGNMEEQRLAARSKLDLLEEIEGVCLRVAEEGSAVGDESWVVAALAMRGLAWADLARAVEEASVPADVVTEVAFRDEIEDLYREEAAAYAERFRDTAEETWKGAMEYAGALGLCGPWIQAIGAMLDQAGCGFVRPWECPPDRP